MGNMYLAASSSKGSGSYTFLIVIVVLFGLLYFVMIRPQRNRQRAVQEKQRQVQPGQRVRTTAGMYATVLEADDEDVLLEVAPGVHIRFLRHKVDSGYERKLLKTVHGYGYKLAADGEDCRVGQLLLGRDKRAIDVGENERNPAQRG